MTGKHYIQNRSLEVITRLTILGVSRFEKLLLNGDLLADLCDEEEELSVKNTFEVWWSIGEQE